MYEEADFLIAAEEGYSVGSVEDILDLIGALRGRSGLLLTEEDLSPDFFDLKSGLAGDLFQKFANYRVRVAIVLPDPSVYGERISELAYEHRTHGLIRFVPSREEGETWLGA